MGRSSTSNAGATTSGPLGWLPTEDSYLGIPRNLVLTLVEVYYDNVYNATLLLHKRTFLESLSAGIVRPHIILSVCAWAAKYAENVTPGGERG